MVNKYQSLRTIFDKKKYDRFPCNDIEAWNNFPEYHHIYNKLWIAESQGVPCGPMGIYPENYPVIFKPVINLFGMSKGIKIINNDNDYDANVSDGVFWEEFLTGTHRCVDLVVDHGKIIFSSCWISIPGKQGTFDHHISDPYYVIPDHILEWIQTFFDEYRGCLNFETIDGIIIECHLRLNGDSQLYNETFAEELNQFLKGETDKINYKIDKKYLIPIFVNKNYQKALDEQKVLSLCDKYDVLSIFFDNINSKYQSEYMSRIIIFDIKDLEKGLELRNIIIGEYL